MKLLILMVVVLTGCANAGCTVTDTPYGKRLSVFLTLDRAIPGGSTITIRDNCEVVIQGHSDYPAPEP